MGVHHWTGYVDYSNSCCEGLKFNFNEFCFKCYTSEDVDGCLHCAIGKTNYMFINYLQENKKKNKHLEHLINTLANEDEYYAFIRLRSKFRPKRPSKKYLDLYEKDSKDLPKSVKHAFKNLFAGNRQECDTIINLINSIKKSKDKW